MANPSLNDATPYSAITAVLVGSMKGEGFKIPFSASASGCPNRHATPEN